jgi:hypothetical protein
MPSIVRGMEMKFRGSFTIRKRGWHHVYLAQMIGRDVLLEQGAAYRDGLKTVDMASRPHGVRHQDGEISGVGSDIECGKTWRQALPQRGLRFKFVVFGFEEEYFLQAALGIKKTALQEWERDNPEFKEAMDIGRAASTAKWISKTRERAFGESRYGSDRLLEFMLKNKDPEFREHDKEIARISSSGNNSITALSSDTLLSILNDLKNASDER